MVANFLQEVLANSEFRDIALRAAAQAEQNANFIRVAEVHTTSTTEVLNAAQVNANTTRNADAQIEALMVPSTPSLVLR